VHAWHRHSSCLSGCRRGSGTCRTHTRRGDVGGLLQYSAPPPLGVAGAVWSGLADVGTHHAGHACHSQQGRSGLWITSLVGGAGHLRLGPLQSSSVARPAFDMPSWILNRADESDLSSTCPCRHRAANAVSPHTFETQSGTVQPHIDVPAFRMGLLFDSGDSRHRVD
jgi:hypothetical protein